MVTLYEVSKATTQRISFTKVDPLSGKESSHAYNVRIPPPGVRESQRLRVTGQGGAGVGGGPAGDLFLRVHYAKHPEFRVKGSDL